MIESSADDQLKLALAKFIQKNYTNLNTLLTHVQSVVEELQLHDEPNLDSNLRILYGRKIDQK